jgi:uncharacterized delta-60 repeat protein
MDHPESTMTQHFPVHPRARGLSLLSCLTVASVSGLAGAAAPNVSVEEIYPNLGTAVAPSVRVERVRRSTGDAGLVNFEIDLRNNDGLRELSELRTSYTPAVLATGVFDAFANADLLRTSNGAFGPWGSETIVDRAAQVVAADGRAAAVSAIGDHYLVAGQAMAGDDGEDRFYLARVRRTTDTAPDNDIHAQRTAFPGWTGAAEAVALVPGNKVIAAGQVKDEQGVAYLALAQFSDDAALTPDASFGTAGTRRLGLPGCGDETVTDLVVTGTGADLRTTVTGWGACGGLRRGFLARFLANGDLDTSLDGDGFFMLANPFALGVRGKAVRIRDEWVPPGDVMEPRIYVASELGDDCDSEQASECYVLVSRHRPDGSLDTTFAGTGTKLVVFPQSSGQVPVSLDLLADGKLLVAATRFASADDEAHVGVARLTGAGAIDTSFSGDGFATWQLAGRPLAAVDLVVDALGQIFVGGVTVDDQREPTLVGFTATGTPFSARGNRKPDPGVAVHDLLIDAQGKLVLTGSLDQWSRIVRFRGDGRLDWRGVLDPGETQELFWPDDRELPLPFPTGLALEMYFVGNPTPVALTSAVEEEGFQVVYPWSFTPETRAWTTGGHHRLRDAHRGSDPQRYAHDMGVVAWDGVDEWIARDPGIAYEDLENSDYEAWGEPLHAGASGRVLACWRTAEDNPEPSVRSTIPAPGGGNMFYIENPIDHTVALYAHMQAGSVPPTACPNDCAHYDGDGPSWRPDLPSDTCSHWLDDSVTHTVSLGDQLGLVGNSGNSGGPHFHFHLTQSPTGVNNRATSEDWFGVPAYFDLTWTDERSKSPAQMAAVPLAGAASAAWQALLWRPLE